LKDTRTKREITAATTATTTTTKKILTASMSVFRADNDRNGNKRNLSVVATLAPPIQCNVLLIFGGMKRGRRMAARNKPRFENAISMSADNAANAQSANQDYDELLHVMTKLTEQTKRLADNHTKFLQQNAKTTQTTTSFNQVYCVESIVFL
jgi:hypothetical protein